ncbi:hypothetical protein AKJ37_01895 [candidate division MSBL1 archaeon SCGC-AAA259I09]|uniref:acetate--CoA ligase (ADP-forming) n=1 Tax=candidate division MSBL1 archaeon SCGC-AAA259I09 TaxID=1698267 RepID=A0A133UUV4_9EURY|nr:hypothetical protein AKJ37_01895 [candidate division MSBL1 archaeon SCGC-AAA259I09]
MDKIFEPDNIAVIGATEKEDSVGLTLMKNLIDRPKGETYPVNPKRDEVLGRKSFESVEQIPDPVDLGVIATPASTVPKIVEECGESDISALTIISSGFSETGPKGAKLENKIEKIREKYNIRILGPNCVGFINPERSLNVSLIDEMPDTGNELFISQSGGLATSILDWAISANFGFRAFITTGNMIDIDTGDLIDYFGRDPDVRSILMYIEDIYNARKFISAARSFARTKPILAVKSGKYKERARDTVYSAKQLASSDEVYEAALKRAGITRVNSIEDLFTCSEVLAKHYRPKGSKLAIVTNAHGPGTMASDTLIKNGGQLASLSKETISDLEEILPLRAEVGNPVYITGYAEPEQYKKSVEACLKDEDVDGVLCIYAPVGTMSQEAVAKSIADLKQTTSKTILISLMGGDKVSKGVEILRQSGFSVQFSPEQSVRNYMYLYRFAKNREDLLETPEELPVDRTPPKYHIKTMIEGIAEKGRETLTEVESKKVLETYNVPCREIQVVKSSNQAVRQASKIGFPVLLKINSASTSFEKKIGEKANLQSKNAVREAYEELVDIAKENYPDTETEGLTVQKMVHGEETEIILGSKKDPLFGSVLFFGKGGKYSEYYNDIAVGLPPLNQSLARHLIEETKIYEKIKKFENSSELLRHLDEYLVMLSQLIIDFPEIDEININPLTKIDNNFLALDAEIKIDKDLALGNPEPNEHLVIEPYPRKYVEEWRLNDGRPVTLRPIRPEDEPLMFELWETFSEETIRYRFFGPMKEITHEDSVRFTNIDYRREIAIAGVLEEDEERKMIGVGRLIIDPDEDSGEVAIVVGDPWQELGLGEKLVDSIIRVAKDKGLETIWGDISADNQSAINLSKKLGFEIKQRGNKVKIILEL